MKNLIVLSLSLGLISCSGNQNQQNQVNGLTSKEAIIGGEDVLLTDKKFKSVVGIIMADRFSIPFATCSGTLIDTNIVLTAAHCIQDHPSGTQFFIIFGTHLSSRDKIVSIHQASVAISHRLYDVNKTRDAYDIALIKFNGSAPRDAVIAPVLKDKTYLRSGTQLVVAGFGRESSFSESRSGQLKFANVKVANTRYSATEFRTSQFFKGICLGDSGGPAFVEINGVFHVAGITNRTNYIGFVDCIFSSYFARADLFQDWIEQNTNLLKAN